MVVLEVIKMLFWFSFVCFVGYKANEFINFRFYMDRCYGTRFIELPASLILVDSSKSKDEDRIEYDDPALRKALGYDKEDEDETSYSVNIRYVLDLEEVKSYHEYTFDTYEEGKPIYLNLTQVGYKNGTYTTLNVTFDQFKELHDNYLNTRYNIYG